MDNPHRDSLLFGQQLPGSLKINTNGRNGKPAFDTSLFPAESLGTLGNAKRRVFYGPGINNFDLTLQKNCCVADAKSIELWMEGFNAFNHAQFYSPASVDGQVDDTRISAISPALPHLVWYNSSASSTFEEECIGSAIGASESRKAWRHNAQVQNERRVPCETIRQPFVPLLKERFRARRPTRTCCLCRVFFGTKIIPLHRPAPPSLDRSFVESQVVMRTP